MKRICSICEAGCGLNIATDGRTVTSIEANQADVFSEGHICAKGLSLKELDSDPDRIRVPLLRKNGVLTASSWDEALGFIAERLAKIRAENAPNAVASYIGNPSAHNIGLSKGLGVLLGTLGSTNVFAASSVDQLPKQLASELMFGDGMALPVPDITRADCIVMLGANPAISNGSLWMVPGFRKKLREFQRRGGKLLNVDPRKSETASLADAHFYIKPGGDAFLLGAIINRLAAKGYDPKTSVAVSNWRSLKEALEALTLEQCVEQSGVSADEIEAIVAELTTAQRPVLYGRIGTTLQQHGTVTSFLLEVVNLMLGALDSAGGAMFPEQPFADPAVPRTSAEYNRWQSRVSQAPEVLGQMPCSILAEEIETAGEGQIRSLFCFAGNPVVSNPDSERLTRALKSLELLVCTDIYHNETTQLADVILPGTSPFEDCHYDNFLGSVGWRNSARFSPALFPPEQKSEWDIGLTLGYVAAQGRPPTEAELREFENTIVAAEVSRYVDDPTSPLFEMDVQELVGQITPEHGVERLLDLGIRAGKWGDHFSKSDGLTLQKLIETPDGIDLGELRPNRLKEIVRLANGQIELGPKVILEEVAKLCKQESKGGLRLIGRRQASTNNSWLGNLPMLTKGKSPCFLQMHVQDAKALNIDEGSLVTVSSDVGSIEIEVNLSDDIMRGCVSLPHGFSEDVDLRQGVRRTGPNYNQLAAASLVDAPSGTSALNGVMVEVALVE